MKKVIVTTTINPPTAAIEKYAANPDWSLIVIGDKKTPEGLFAKFDCDFWSCERQAQAFPELSELLGWNTIQRRNIGFLVALQAGATVIATVDDDNIPYENWGQDVKVGQEIEVTSYSSELVFDPLSVTNYSQLWHRGFPIQRLSRRDSSPTTEKIVVDVQADFWNGDPDIDAICRMEHSPECVFDDSCFPFTSSTYSPFNSQNTFLSNRALREYFMFPYIGRMDDIWGSYILQSKGFRTLYSKATVYQNRNNHNLTDDFRKEVLGYERTEEFINSLSSKAFDLAGFVGDKSYAAYLAYLDLSRLGAKI